MPKQSASRICGRSTADFALRLGDRLAVNLPKLDYLKVTLIDPAIRESVQAPLAVSLGAIPGALSRYYLAMLLDRWLGSRFPIGTFVVNLSGSLLMGFFATLAIENTIHPNLQLLISTGFLGAYTTFSTYTLDTTKLLQTSKLAALFYSLGSVGLGGLCLAIGRLLAQVL